MIEPCTGIWLHDIFSWYGLPRIFAIMGHSHLTAGVMRWNRTIVVESSQVRMLRTPADAVAIWGLQFCKACICPCLSTVCRAAHTNLFRYDLVPVAFPRIINFWNSIRIAIEFSFLFRIFNIFMLFLISSIYIITLFCVVFCCHALPHLIHNRYINNKNITASSTIG